MSIPFNYKIYKPGPYNLISTGRGELLPVIGYAVTPNPFLLDGADHDKIQTFRDFPELVEVHTWCIETFGADAYEWKSYYVIGSQRYSDAVGKRDIFAQYHFKTHAQMSLFKLRWHS